MDSKPTKILLVDDNADTREMLQLLLQGWDFEVRLASEGEEARVLTESYDPDVVISDVMMPGISGLDLLHCLNAANPNRPIILITAKDSVDLAVEAMKEGAHDFLTKPLDFSKLKAALGAAQRDVEARRESHNLIAQLEKDSGFGELVGTSKAMLQIYNLIRSVGKTDASVLITGESGTGKELVARSIHQLSPRASGPLVAINAAAIPETLIETELFGHEKGAFTGAVSVGVGCFERADRGTLFLDEIAEMPILLQSRLLRVVEGGRVRRVGGQREHTFDVRVMAATNLDPQSAIKNGKLREDLYFRLNVFALKMPPLREHMEDVHLLVQHFIREFNHKHACQVEAVRDGALKLLRNYSWPGNVRELRNIIERAVILARAHWIEISHLPAYVQDVPPQTLPRSLSKAANA